MADRRRLLQELLGDASAPPLSADATGAGCLWSLMLPRVRAAYGPVVKPWPENTEPLVHETRVATRRLVEAARMGTPALGTKASRRACERAQTLRRRLGQSREADVVLVDLRHLAERAGLDAEATSGLEALRTSGVRALEAVAAAYPPSRLLRHAVDVLEAATEPRRIFSLRELGASYLHDKTQAALPLIPSLASSANVADHHRLRIRFKAVRYTVEILSEAFADVLLPDQTLARLKVIQDVLGDLNDAQDAELWLNRRPIKGSLDSRVREHLRAASRVLQNERWEIARDTVADEAHELLGFLRRVSGKIGPLYRVSP